VIAISYRREDSVAVAGRLYDRLESAFGRQNVFMDFDSIPAGVNFREYIVGAIERSQLVIALIGPKWLGEKADSRRIDQTDDFVRLEIASALARGISVIPVLVNDAEMPRPDQLPPDLRELPFLNALPLDSGRDFQIHAERLISVIRAIHSPARAARSRWREPMIIWIILAAVFVLAALIFALIISSRPEPDQSKKPSAVPTPVALSSTPTPAEVTATATPTPSATPAALREFLGSWSNLSKGPITGGAGAMTVLDEVIVEPNAINETISNEWTSNGVVLYRIKLRIRYGELWVSGNELNARCWSTEVDDVFDPQEFAKIMNLSEQIANGAKAGVNLIYKFALTGSELRRGETVFTRKPANLREASPSTTPSLRRKK
jgi:hypothetical protein